MSALDVLISSSKGLCLAPDYADARTPALKAPIGKSPAGGAILRLWEIGFRCFVLQRMCLPQRMCVLALWARVLSLNTACETTSHTQKFVVQPGALYIRHGGKEAFCSPYTKTAEEWCMIFVLVEAQGSGHPMDPAGVVKRLELYDQAMATRTPYKKMGDDASTSFFEGFSPLEQTNPTSANKSEFMWEESGELPASFVERFKKLETATVALSTTVPTVIGAIGGRLGHQEAGPCFEHQHPADCNGRGAPTLWGALQGAYLESDRLRSQLAQFVQGPTAAELKDMRDEQHDRLVEWLEKKIAPVLQDANAEVVALQLRVTTIETASLAQPPQASRPPVGNLSTLFQASLTGAPSARSTTARSDIKVLQLEKKMENLEHIVGSEGVQFGGLGWRIQSEAGACADQFLNMYSLGCFVDVCTFLEHVHTGHNGEKSGTLNKLEKLKKLNVSPADATVLVAHSNYLVPGLNATKTHLPALSK
eukprot:scaffold22560_cov57-Attheya_sp.AAC.3